MAKYEKCGRGLTLKIKVYTVEAMVLGAMVRG